MSQADAASPQRLRCAVSLGAAGLLLVVLANGCAPMKANRREYTTLSAKLSRDSELAAQKHAEAVELIEPESGDRRDLTQAESLLRDALVADVNYGPAHNALGVVYLMTGRLYLAAWEFEMAAQTMPSLGEPHNNLGMVYEQAGRYDDAASAYELAASLQPGQMEYVGNLARARLRRGDSAKDVQRLLSEVAFADARPEWAEWARRKLALSGLEVLSTGPAFAERARPLDDDSEPVLPGAPADDSGPLDSTPNYELPAPSTQRQPAPIVLPDHDQFDADRGPIFDPALFSE